jgi:predicted Co/Zn/Cd cation transporter (cation efflux family)
VIAAAARTTADPELTGSTQAEEIRALHLSLALTVLFACGAVVVALFSDSETMTVEAITAGIDIAVALLAIFVARKLQEPANERYHFGYAKYEPLDIARQAVAEGMMLLHPDVDVAVLFRSAPAKPQSAEPPPPPHSQRLATKQNRRGSA